MAPRMRIARALARTRKVDLPTLPELFGYWLDPKEPSEGRFYDRIFTPVRVFWMFLAQTLSADGACREALSDLLGWLSFEHEVKLSPSTSAYCQARGRLPKGWIETLAVQVVEHLEQMAAGLWLWHDRRVKVLDGSTISMPDTATNQKSWPQPSGTKAGCAFPVLRLVCTFCLSTGAMLSWAFGSLLDDERSLWRRQWMRLQDRDILLADRGFSSFADYWLLTQLGVDCVMRLQQKRAACSRLVKQLGKNDRLVEWVKNGVCPKWMTDEQWQALPASIIVREITYDVPIADFRTKSIILATTLLDPLAYPADFAQLFRRRWQVELYLRDIKTTMRMEVLRCKSPQMIEKELLMHLIAYNLVRGLMIEAAEAHAVPPDQLSFKGALTFVRTWAPMIASQTDPGDIARLQQSLLHYIARMQVGHRPNRIEPRARKRRPKNYQLLTEPRHAFKEIKHRNKYYKPKS